jgi:hypothetical protein
MLEHHKTGSLFPSELRIRVCVKTKMLETQLITCQSFKRTKTWHLLCQTYCKHNCNVQSNSQHYKACAHLMALWQWNHFALCSSRRFYPRLPPTSLILICWMLQTNQKEKTLYPKLKLPQKLHFVSIKNEPGS